MKWSVIALVALGTIAALCASVLVGALRSSDRVDATEAGAQARETTIVVAARNLPQGVRLESDALAVEQISIAGAPKSFIADPVLAVGKILRAAVVKDQPILTSDFAEGLGLRVAVALPPGMLAVGISLGGSSGLQGLLYSGCNVDVLATSRPERGKEPATRMLLERVRVLRIEGEMIVSSENTKVSSGRSTRRSGTVVLELNAQQARILQSAAASGTLSLAMRNPMDEATASVEEQPEDETVAEKESESEEEEHVTEEINGGTHARVTYIRRERGDPWQRKER